MTADDLEYLFNVDWLNEWRRMMCLQERLKDERGNCAKPYSQFPCTECLYHVISTK